MREGDWKLVSFYQHQWELYNIAEDRLEQNDLAAKMPKRVEAMKARWYEYAKGTDMKGDKQIGPVKNKPSPNNQGSWHAPEKVADWKMPKL